MRRFTLMFVVVAVLCGTTSVHAKELRSDGNELLQYCTDESPTLVGLNHSGRCFGYLKGFVDTMSLFALPNCMPDEVTMGQVRRIVVKHLQDHPAELHYSMVSLVNLALNEAYPCTAQPAPK